jgi:cysteine dioxygenase
MTMSIEQFHDALDEHGASVPLGELVQLMTDVEISVDDVADCIKFSDECYQRNLWRCGPGYAAIILCWKAGQASPIHDHKGSACGVRVLEGRITEIYSKKADGSLQPGRTRIYEPGSVCGSYDTDIHVIANREFAGDLVTLHVYTPPMSGYRVFEPDGLFHICEDSTAKKVAALVAAMR